MYKSFDVNLLQKNWNNIIENVDIKKHTLEPTINEKLQIHTIVVDYIKEKKRKLYGGYCLFQLVALKNKSDATKIYKSHEVCDVDFYSPEPLIDIVNLCDILYKKGYKHIVSREAFHHETYNIIVNCEKYCDITYVPKNIYNKIPFKEENGLMLTHPHFLAIDYLRIFTDPVDSYWRMSSDIKYFKRYALLQQYYPLPNNNTSEKVTLKKNEPYIDDILKVIIDFATNNDNVIMLGFYAYNYFVQESKTKKYVSLNTPYYEMICINYKNDCLNLIELITKHVKSNYDKEIKYSEFYPFFQFTDHSTEIYMDDILIARIYGNNNKCIPYQKIQNGINLCTFQTFIMFCLISIMKSRTINDEHSKNLYYMLLSNSIDIRGSYLYFNKKTFLDDTIFKDFITDFKGEGIRPEKQRRLLIEHRKKQGKKLVFTYEPSDTDIKDVITSYTFSNSSGNKIINQKKSKLNCDTETDVSISKEESDVIISKEETNIE